jgi:hypothetical protein
MTFVFPTSAELKEVEQEKLPRLLEHRPVFQIMPIQEVDAHLLEWEQEDSWTGLQQLRGLGGPFQRVEKGAVRRYMVIPGVYGEFLDLDEIELTTLRQFGSWDRPADLSALVMRAQDRLLERRLDRIEQIAWELLSTGSYSVPGDSGIEHRDSFDLQTETAAAPWSSAATATPLSDLREVQLQARGKGVSFGTQATAWMNQVTFNRLISNTNADDLGGRRLAGMAPVNGRDDLNRLLAGENLPAVRVYDEGYLDDNGDFAPFIVDDVVIVTGHRPTGVPIADYALTRNANNPGLAPGAFTEVRVQEEPPKRVTIYDGHNGGPRVYFPSAVVVLSV